MQSRLGAGRRVQKNLQTTSLGCSQNSEQTSSVQIPTTLCTNSTPTSSAAPRARKSTCSKEPWRHRTPGASASGTLSTQKSLACCSHRDETSGYTFQSCFNTTATILNTASNPPLCQPHGKPLHQPKPRSAELSIALGTTACSCRIYIEHSHTTSDHVHAYRCSYIHEVDKHAYRFCG